MRDGIIAAVVDAPVRPVRGPWAAVVTSPGGLVPRGSPMATCGQIWPGCTNPQPPYGTSGVVIGLAAPYSGPSPMRVTAREIAFYRHFGQPSPARPQT